MGLKSPGGSIYWRKNLSLLSNYVEDQSKETLEIADIGLVWNKDPSLRIRKTSSGTHCPTGTSRSKMLKKEEKMMKRKMPQ